MKLPEFPTLRFGAREDYTPVGALRALLRYHGLDVPYATLMAVSGAAFRHAWAGNAYQSSALLAAPEPVLPPVIDAYGLKATRLNLQREDAAWPLLAEALATGHGVLFWGGSRWRAAGLLFGYEDWPSGFWARTYTDRDGEGREVSFTAWKEMAQEGIEAWVFDLTGARGKHDTFGILHRAVSCMQADGDGLHQFGLAAYESWARTLETSPPMAGSRESTICMAASRTLIDARRAAANWLQGLPLPLPSSLVNAIDSYTDFRFLMDELNLAFQNARKPADGVRLAKLVRAAGQEDARAVGAISASISIMAL